jgi:hypothetical protein
MSSKIRKKEATSISKMRKKTKMTASSSTHLLSICAFAKKSPATGINSP